ncbi:MAG: glycyl-radical enzyme activating protein [Desulfamplus sp.]|nr:glycyl-radical enzyme activating protein [Desulfamplus sp.]
MHNNKTCTIFDIKRYAIHDGPGIRTTIFFKGCPLSCLWCHNPEGIEPKPKTIYDPKKCIGCFACVYSCPDKALKVQQNGIYPSDENLLALCSRCYSLICADVCPTKSRERVGKICSVDDILKEVQKDIAFYEESDGGVTFSGGEPLMQWEALVELLKGCKSVDIHTAVDTTGFTSWSILKKVAQFTDLFLFDLKMLDDKKHKLYTGVSNKSILENLKKLALLIKNQNSSVKKRIIIRMPLIPTINDDEANIEATGKFIADLEDNRCKSRVKEVNLLPYHDFQRSKYLKFGIDYKPQNILAPTQEQIKRVQERLEAFDLTVSVG